VVQRSTDRVGGACPPAGGQSPQQPRLQVQHGRVGSDRSEHHHRQAAGHGAGGGVGRAVRRVVPALQPHHHAACQQPPRQEISLPGNSGGPLVCDGKARAIVSHGSGDWSTPSVFTRLSKYVCWIKKTLQKLNL
ncbi:unnamed protein product, partial [Eretmochelys imbricata]